MGTNLQDSPPRMSGQTSIGFQRWILLQQINKTLQRMHTSWIEPGNNNKNKPERRIKLETDESQTRTLLCWNHLKSLRPSPTMVGDKMSNSIYACCEGLNNSTKLNKWFTRETCLCKKLVCSCYSSSFKRKYESFLQTSPQWTWVKSMGKNISSRHHQLDPKQPLGICMLFGCISLNILQLMSMSLNKTRLHHHWS